jgi:hypothetical protein
MLSFFIVYLIRLSITDTAFNDRMINEYELKSYGRKWLWPKLRYHPSIHVEGLRNTTKSSGRIAGIQAQFETTMY